MPPIIYEFDHVFFSLSILTITFDLFSSLGNFVSSLGSFATFDKSFLNDATKTNKKVAR